MAFNQNSSSLKEVLPIALASLGAYHIISGLKTLGIKAMLQTALGGWLLYRGMQGFSDDSYHFQDDLLFDDDGSPYIEETDVFGVIEDPTVE